jgi:ABC-2 type transport system ATP-binding protein
VAVLLTTQYLLEAEELAGAVAVLHGGRIVAEGTPAEVKSGLGVSSLDEAFLALTAAAGNTAENMAATEVNR